MEEEKRKKCEAKNKKQQEEEVKTTQDHDREPPKKVPNPHRGIPEAKFVHNVDEFMALPENDGNAVKVLKRFDEEYSKYIFMEYNLAAQRKKLKSQIPELQKSIDVMGMLENMRQKGKEMKTQFILSEPVYLKALIPPTDKVYLGVGANIILEYTLSEAVEHLRKNLAEAKKNLETIEEDLDFLRDQFTTTEVNMARVFNWNIKKKQNAPQ